MPNPILKYFLLAAVVTMAVSLAPHALADIAINSALSAPTTTSNVGSGMNEILRFTFMFFKFLAVIACGWGSYQMYKGEFSSGFWAYVATAGLFFAPAIVDYAQKVGKVAMNAI